MPQEDYRDQARRSWDKLLNADQLRFNLTIASVFLTAYELLLQSLVERLRDFFGVAWTANETEVGPEYKSRVLSRHEMPYSASADWFVEMGALTDRDVDALRAIRDHRNFVAHNIPKIVMDASVEVDLDLLGEIVRLVTTLDRWWLAEVEIPTDPDWDNRVTDEDLKEVVSLRMITLQLLISFAAGDEESLRSWRTAFNEVWSHPGEERGGGTG